MEQSRSPEEIAELNKGRKISDTEALGGGANYVTDSNAERPRLEFTDEQVDQVKKEHEAEYEPVYLREGREAWQEDVNNFIYNRHAYSYPQKYPFNYERQRGSNELIAGSDKYQRVAATIDGSVAAAAHEFGKHLGGTFHFLNRLMEKSSVPEGVRLEIRKKYQDEVVRDKRIRLEGGYGLSVKEYQKEIEEKCPELLPTDKSIQEINPLIRLFLQPLSATAGNEVPATLIQSARDAGRSVVFGNFYSELSQFMNEVEVILKHWVIDEQFQRVKQNLFIDLVGLAWHSFPEQDPEK